MKKRPVAIDLEGEEQERKEEKAQEQKQEETQVVEQELKGKEEQEQEHNDKHDDTQELTEEALKRHDLTTKLEALQKGRCSDEIVLEEFGAERAASSLETL